jgi:protein phosphatase
VEQSSRSGAKERLAFAGVTDVGRQRKHNEDCLLVRGDLDLFCVADGMGGHNAGDVASKLVATSLANFFEATRGVTEHELGDEYATIDPAARRLAAGVSKANRDVFTISNTVHQHHGMGSTCVAIHLDGDKVHIAHVGDSRCYRIRDGELMQMTRDHSLINDALDMKPDLTKEELSRLPKNIITRALGMKDVVKVDVKTEALLPGDIFLLCSDGLTGMVPVDHIVDVLNLTPDPQEACELLVAEANDHGGTDNISALIVRAGPPAPRDAPDVEVAPQAELVEDDDLENGETLEMVVDEAPSPTPPSPPPPPSRPIVRAPILEIVADADAGEDADETAVATGLLTEEETAALASGAEIDLDVRGAWGASTDVFRCTRCRFELFPGNAFCVECGQPIEAAPRNSP